MIKDNFISSKELDKAQNIHTIFLCDSDRVIFSVKIVHYKFYGTRVPDSPDSPDSLCSK